MADASQKALLDGLARAIKKHLEETAPNLSEEAQKNLPARTAVVLLELSGLYFASTEAPKDVIKKFVDEFFGLNQPVSLIHRV